ncbi:hypothetical protein BC941DRAFT_437862 [Chlamydoabsidia padenii]|nr:hypothetical protein BC941DRAFT_437862 [Chlamydoabsidia padenii]
MLDEWSKKSHNRFNVATFKRDLETVSGHIGVSTEGLQHDHANKMLKEGCAKLGVPAPDCPNNTRSYPYDNNSCFGGTRQGARKQGTANIWLRDAEAYGARFMEHTTVTKILTRNGQAIGVRCMHNNTTPCTFTAKIIVVAAGSLHTPNLLLRSGLKNKHIGRHLQLHPTSFVQGFYPQHQQQDGPVASAMTHVSDGDQHRGARIHVAALPPALAATCFPWHGALAHKQTMAKYAHMVPLAIMVCDGADQAMVTDQGKVVHTLSRNEEINLMQGIVRAFRILAITGATELYHSQLAIEPFRFDHHAGVDAVKDSKFNAWLDRVQAHGLPDGIFSMHQMGTCRMGRNAHTSVAQTTGETWEIENLFIGDGSLFMTASGVDPMLTVETLAYGVSRHIIARLGKQSW